MLFLVRIALPWESVFIKCHVKKMTMTIAVVFNKDKENECTPKKGFCTYPCVWAFQMKRQTGTCGRVSKCTT